MNIKPIHDDQDHAAALREVERLWGAPPDTPDGDRLEVLVTLIDCYENATIKIAAADPIEVLQFAIKEMGRSQAELASLLGSRSRASEILNRKRKLAVAHIAQIVTAWRLPAELLVQPYALARSSAPGHSQKGRRSPKAPRAKRAA